MTNPKKSLTSLSEMVQTHTFNRGGGSIELDIDIDAFTEDYFRGVGRRQKERYRARVLKNAEEEKAREAERLRVQAEADSLKPAPEAAGSDTVPVLLPADIDPLEVTLENVDESMRVVDQIWERSATFVEDKKTLRVDMLLDGAETHVGSVLRGWDAENDDGGPARLNAATLMKLSPRAVEELWEFCAEKARTVKKNPEDEETEEPGSSGQPGTFSRSAAG